MTSDTVHSGASVYAVNRTPSEARSPNDTSNPGGIPFAPATGDPSQTTTTTRTATPAHHGPIDSGEIGKISAGLIFVIAVILLAGYILKRFGPYRSHTAKAISVVSSQSIGQRERVVIVEIEDEWLVLGVTPTNVNKLHVREAPRRPSGPTPGPPPERPTFGQAFAHNLRQARDRMGGRPDT